MSLPLILACALSVVLAPLHPNSWSMSKIVVDAEGSALIVFLRTQALSLQEVVDLDPDGNLLVDRDEFDAVRDAIGAYVLGHYLLRVDPDGEPLRGEVVTIDLVDDARDALGFQQFVDLELRFAVDGPVRRLDVEQTLFLDTSPQHQDRCDVHWPGEPKQAAVFWSGNTRQVFTPGTPPPRTIREDLELGVDHILFGYDHLAFLLGLVVASSRLRSVLGVVTAFTLAHSVTLTLAALDVVSLPQRPVEIAIALSIAYVGAANLLWRRPRPLWIEAFVFGLVHGLGFATVLSAVLADQAERLSTLVAFNVGIELGQFAVVTAVVVLLRLMPRRPRVEGETPWLAPAAVRVIASIGVFGLGAVWAVERILA